MVTCTGHIGIHEGADGRTDGLTTYVRTDVRDVIAIKPNFLTSMGYHIFFYGAPRREVCADRIMEQHARPIGGPGTTVEIHESKFSKMKYHKGRYIEGQWVFGGICRETKACFLVPVERRDKEILLPIIRAQILPGARVMSDMWKAYYCLQDEGYHHLTVNHRLNFVDPDTRAHTQSIEIHGGE